MVTVSISKAGQMKITIPRLIAEAIQLKHKSGIRFGFNGHNWEMIRDDKHSSVSVFIGSNGQMKMTIPKLIAEAMQLQSGTKLSFVFNGKGWELRKEVRYG